MEREPTKAREETADDAGELDDRMTALRRNRRAGFVTIERVHETRPGTVAVRFALPHGDDAFTRSFTTPDAPADAKGRPLTDLLEAIDVPIDEVESLNRYEVPVEWTGDGWQLDIPDSREPDPADRLADALRDVDWSDDTIVAGGGLVAGAVLLALIGVTLTGTAIITLIPVVVVGLLATALLAAFDEYTGIDEVDDSSRTQIEAGNITVDTEAANSEITVEDGDTRVKIDLDED